MYFQKVLSNTFQNTYRIKESKMDNITFVVTYLLSISPFLSLDALFTYRHCWNVLWICVRHLYFCNLPWCRGKRCVCLKKYFFLCWGLFFWVPLWGILFLVVWIALCCHRIFHIAPWNGRHIGENSDCCNFSRRLCHLRVRNKADVWVPCPESSYFWVLAA